MSATRHKTMCPMNCHPTLCGMEVEIENGRLKSIKGDRDNPDSAGFLCVRGLAAKQIPHHPERLSTPLMRDSPGRKWQSASWDTVLGRIAAELTEIGPARSAMWIGHGELANDYGATAHARLAGRFANLWGCHGWGAQMICWGLGGLGFGLTGVIDVNSKEDMSAHSDLIVLWGANLVSQPNTARHLALAKRRGAKVLAIDMRESEACRSAHDAFLVRPGTDAALALGIMHVLIAEDLVDREFVEKHALGMPALQAHVHEKTPEWASDITGLEVSRIVELARMYAGVERAMLVVGGSSMFKDRNGWMASRAISCLPALTGKLGKEGAGIGPRHGAVGEGFALNDISAADRRPPGPQIPGQMSSIIDAVTDGQLDAFLLFGTNFISSFADATRIKNGLARMRLVVGHDLFMNETIERYGHVMLPATAWLEDVGCKMTHTHAYLMDRILPPLGDSRPMHAVLRGLAERLGLDGFYPWEGETGHLDAVLNADVTGHATIDDLRAEGGTRALMVPSVAYRDRRFPTPSGKVEFFCERAAASGLPALPDYQARSVDAAPIELRFGRTINHFHSFYDHARKLSELTRREAGPEVWIAPADAEARRIREGDEVRLRNARGSFDARAKVTSRVSSGTAWIHDGWAGLNDLSDGSPSVPDAATSLFRFTTGQAAYDTRVEITLRTL